jgi:AraC-like DNA-binding protein
VARQAVWSRVLTGSTPLDLLHARIVQPYARHIHGEYAIGACTHGLEEIYYRGELHPSGPGSIALLEPGEVHAGAPAGDAGFRYRVMYPGAGWFGEPAPHFAEPVVHAPGLATRLVRAHQLLSECPSDAMAGESLLVEVFAELLARYASPPANRLVDVRAGRLGIASRVMRRLGDEPAAPPSLAEVAAELGMSRYQLVRGFAQEVGLPPYAWLAQHRVARARGLLELGCRPGEVAAMVGFADQAHLTRWFRRVLGVTPAVYRNSVQDA